MAISRRSILRLGVSYGTGAINFGNDSIAYERALRQFGDDTLLQELLEALANAEDVVLGEEGGAEGDPGDLEAEIACEAATACEAAGESDAPNSPAEMEALKAPEELEGECAVENGPTAEAPNPLAGAIEKAKEFQRLCAQLALSDLFVRVGDMVAAMEAQALPAADDVRQLRERYEALVDYLGSC